MGKVLLVLLSLLALSAQAATYRWIDADGRVTYGDRPPANGARLVQDTDGDGGITPPATAGALPYAVRSAASRFPVRLYTSRNCEPCEAARAHLIQRGVPFTEKMLTNGGDLAAFKQLGFTESKVPAVSVGRERVQLHPVTAEQREEGRPSPFGHPETLQQGLLVLLVGDPEPGAQPGFHRVLAQHRQAEAMEGSPGDVAPGLADLPFEAPGDFRSGFVGESDGADPLR